MRNLLLAAVVGSTVGFLAGCQTYDFERVEPLAVAQTTQSKSVVAKALKPNLMLLVDKSGSMNLPINPSDPACPANCGNGTPCPNNCKTRISELKGAMAGFLQASGKVARFGVSFYPTNTTCQAVLPAMPTDVGMPPLVAGMEGVELSDSTLQNAADAVNTKIQAVQPGGGTPTGESLTVVGSIPELNASDLRDDFVLLLTDGLPNCNASNPTNNCSGTNNPACVCTLSGPCTGNYCAQGCLDRSGVVQRIQDLRAKGVRVIVVGFGADTATGVAADTLNAMAAAGGYPHACPNGTDAECGTNNSCVQSTKVCASQFYQAANRTELGDALAKISASLQGDSICSFTLDAQPSDPKLLAVKVNGNSVATGADTWKFEGGKVIFQGANCDLLKAATPGAPVKVDITILEKIGG